MERVVEAHRAASRAVGLNVQRAASRAASHAAGLFVSDKVRDRVAMLRAEGRRRRLLVQVPPIVVGVFIGIMGILFNLSMVVGRREENSVLFLSGLVCIHIGPWCAALAIRPQDRRTVRTFCAFASCLCYVGMAICVRWIVGAFRYAATTQTDAGPYLFVCAIFILFLGCMLASMLWSYAIVADLLMIMKVSARQTLARMWHGAGLLYIFSSMSYIVLAVLALAFPTPIAFQRSEAALLIALAIIVLTQGMLSLWEPLRTRVQEALARIGEGVSAAAGIAELIGGLPPEEVMSRARLSFRAVPIASLTREHFVRAPTKSTAAQEHYPRYASAVVAPDVPPASSAVGLTPAAAAVAGGAGVGLSDAELYGTSVPAALGSVDAFISHSWHDDVDKKFAAIQKWRTQFVQQHNREPTVWFDRLCIDQANVAAQLPTLPVYLAGCKTVLALQGRTYFQRLWCVLELHIFHQMGGSLDEIHFVPLNDDSEANDDLERAATAAADAGDFDVRRAQAAQADDQARLLAVIEGSGEGIAAFNQWVCRTLLPAAAIQSRPSVVSKDRCGIEKRFSSS